MEHYQQQIACGVCTRLFIIDVSSIGTSHQFIQAVTCYACAEQVKGRIMGKDEVEVVEITKALKFDEEQQQTEERKEGRYKAQQP